MEATIGGTRRHLCQLALGLPADRYEVTVAASAEREAGFRKDLDEFRRAGRGVLELPMVRSIDRRRDRAHLRELRQVLRQGRFDIVHTHSSKAGALGRWASYRERVGRRIHTPHTFAFAFAGGFSPVQRAVYYGAELALGRLTDRLIAVSPSEAAQARALRVVAKHKIRVVENGIDARPFLASPPRENARQALDIRPGAPVGVVVALWNRAKGQLDALEALARVPAASRPRLAFVGGVSDAAYGDEVARAADRLGLGDWILTPGHRSDVPLWFAAADFAVCPSRWEGMPYAILEAMASARAVLATSTNGARDAVVQGSTGELVKTMDAVALAEGLARFAGDPALCARYGEAGRARVLERYTLDEMIRRTADVYEETLTSGGARNGGVP
jgi:glycosyltransferase involved in cell wall biosynthesis